MDKVKPEGVERLPVYKAVIRMVEKISGKRVADMGQRNLGFFNAAFVL